MKEAQHGMGQMSGAKPAGRFAPSDGIHSRREVGQ